MTTQNLLPTVPAPRSAAEHAYLRRVATTDRYRPVSTIPSSDWVSARIEFLKDTLGLLDPSSKLAKVIYHEVVVLGGAS